LDRLHALRQIERTHDVDLGAVCWRWEHRTDEATHPLERQVMEYVAEARGTGSEWMLWVRLDRVRALRELMEGRLVGEPEGTQAATPLRRSITTCLAPSSRTSLRTSAMRAGCSCWTARATRSHTAISRTSSTTWRRATRSC